MELGIIKTNHISSPEDVSKFGFIICVRTGARVYFGLRDVVDDPSQLAPGTPVTFTLKQYRDNRTGKPRQRAMHVKAANPQMILDVIRATSRVKAVWPPQHARFYTEVSPEAVKQLRSI